MKQNAISTEFETKAEEKLRKRKVRMRRLILGTLKTGLQLATLPLILSTFFLLIAISTPVPASWKTVTVAFQSCKVYDKALCIYTTNGERYVYNGSHDMSFSEMQAQLKPGEIVTITYHRWTKGNMIDAMHSDATEYTRLETAIRQYKSDTCAMYVFFIVFGLIALALIVLSFVLSRKVIRQSYMAINRLRRRIQSFD